MMLYSYHQNVSRITDSQMPYILIIIFWVSEEVTHMIMYIALKCEDMKGTMCKDFSSLILLFLRLPLGYSLRGIPHIKYLCPP